MTVTVKYSNAYKDKLKRMKHLPKLSGHVISAGTMRTAMLIIKYFQQGIRTSSFNLQALKEMTIEGKKSAGFDKPETPLFGKGDRRKKDTYINCLRIKKLKNEVIIYVSKAKHWSGGITLYDLFIVHEFGALIKRGDTIIRIPKRPALFLAYKKYLGGRRADKRETSKQVRRVMIDYIHGGKLAHKMIEEIKTKENEFID